MQAKAITRLDYCQYLLVSQNNYTLTHYAEHHPEEISHDRINRYLRDDKLTPKLVWEKVKQDIVPDNEGILIFDDSILDKNHSHKSNWLTVNIVAMPIASSRASVSLTVFMSTQRRSNIGSLTTVSMTKIRMAKVNLTI